MMNANQKILLNAVSAIQLKQPNYSKLDNYFEGIYELCFSSTKYRNRYSLQFRNYSLNLLPPIVRIISARLAVTGHTLVESKDASRSKAIERALSEIWRMNRMDVRAKQVHQDTLKYGDGYVVIWPDEQGRPTIYPQRADEMTVWYNPENPGHIVKAAKMWLVTDEEGRSRTRLTLYYPDRLERYISAEKSSILTLKNVSISGDFQFITDEEPIVNNPFGKVPVFHFANGASVGKFGVSELEGVLKEQDALNKSVIDMMVAKESGAFPQRFMTGLEDFPRDSAGNIINPFDEGVDTIFAVKGKDVQFGQFDATDIAQYIDANVHHISNIALISGVPAHYFNLGSGGWPSGESLKTAEGRLTAKVKDLQISWGMVWSDVMRLALQMNGFDDADAETQWQNTEPRNEKGDLENAVIKMRDLGIPAEIVWAEIGYSNKEIERIKELKEEDVDSMLTAFNRGLGDVLDSPSSSTSTLPASTGNSTTGMTTAAPPTDTDKTGGIAAETTLNGAQITAAITLLQSLKTGAVTTFVATELLVGLGIPRDTAEQMVSSA